MMKKLFILCSLYILFTSNISLGYDWLYVQDPQNTWRGGQGTINEALLSIKPKGLYIEYGLYLTFSARDLYFNHNDTLEVQFFFDLPQGAIVNDLWLWVNNDIMQALILDKWTASSIYENIVKRRRDPAILFKRSNNSYELRIFPMAGDEVRKVKLTYLVPAQFAENSIYSYLPVSMLKTSLVKSDLKVLFWPSGELKNPSIPEVPAILFQSGMDSTLGNYLRADIPADKLNSNLSFQVEFPFKDGVYLNTYSKGGYGYYQLAIKPNECLGLNEPKKAAILIDYDLLKSYITKQELLTNLKTMLKTNFSEKDSFNLIFSSLEIKRVRNNWIPADTAAIEAVFNSISINDISNYSNLPSLLNNGIDFLNTTGEDGNLILISNSDQVGDYQVANQLLNDLKLKMNKGYPISVIDYAQKNLNYYYFNSRYFYGNEYFFSNLARITYGEYFTIREQNSISLLLSSAFQKINSLISSFDVYTSLENGFCYSRINLFSSNSIYLNEPVLQVGKYIGDSPFKVSISGIYKDTIFQRVLQIDESNVSSSDSVLEKIWAGNHIRNLEREIQSNSVIAEIIDYSLSERVLSTYTAFIALEPSDTIKACYACQDETGVLSVEDEIFVPNDLTIKAFPNPFNNQVRLNVVIPEDMNDENLTFTIYNILGEVVKTFDIIPNKNGKYEIEWNGINDYGEHVTSGIYLFVVKTAKRNYSYKIILMK